MENKNHQSIGKYSSIFLLNKIKHFTDVADYYNQVENSQEYESSEGEQSVGESGDDMDDKHH